MFARLKKLMSERIEKDCIKVNVSKEGEEPKYIYIKNPQKKTAHVIYSPINLESVEKATDKEGNVDWDKVKFDKVALIFGSYNQAIKTAIAGILTLGVIFGVWQLIANWNALISNECVKGCMKVISLSAK